MLRKCNWHWFFPLCHKILPLVYDESLSYYEVLCKLMHKIGELIDMVNELIERHLMTYGGQWQENVGYPAYTVVTDENGNIYITTKDTPAGVELGDSEYYDKLLDMDGINTAITKLKNDVTSLKGRVTALENSSSGLAGRVTTLENTVSSLDSRIDTLEACCTSVQNSISSLTSRVATLETNYTNLNGRMGSAETSIVNLGGRVTTTETNVTNLTGRVTTVEGKVSTLEEYVCYVPFPEDDPGYRHLVAARHVGLFQPKANAPASEGGGALPAGVYWETSLWCIGAGGISVWGSTIQCKCTTKHDTSAPSALVYGTSDNQPKLLIAEPRDGFFYMYAYNLDGTRYAGPLYADVIIYTPKGLLSAAQQAEIKRLMYL